MPTKEIIKIALAEDHNVMRQGLANLLNRNKKIEVVFTCSNGQEFLAATQLNEIEVAIIDLEMPIVNGFELLKELNLQYPTLSVIILSMNYTESFISKGITSGAKAYLPKDVEVEQLVNAIIEVSTKGVYYSKEVTQAVINTMMVKRSKKRNWVSSELSKREKMVVKLICEEKTTKEIANILSLSVRTVETHRSHIFDKTDATNVVGVIKYAIRNGLVDVH